MMISFSVVRLARSTALVYSFKIPGRSLWTFASPQEYQTHAAGNMQDVNEQAKQQTQTESNFHLRCEAFAFNMRAAHWVKTLNPLSDAHQASSPLVTGT